MKQEWMLAAMLLLACDASAQTVQKCVARDGHARYQSEPCGRGERVAEVWDATPEPVEPPETRAPRRVRAPRAAAASGRQGSRGNGSAKARAPRASAALDACSDARAYRDAVERRAGLARDYDLLAALQARVFDACR